MKPDRINSLTGLRAFAMLTIFGCHLSYLAETPFQRFYSFIDNGRLGVNFFLVLSGFVLALTYSNKMNVNSIKSGAHFLKKRISKIYIPYLLTMILAMPLYIFNTILEENSLNVELLISRLIINISMMQSAIPFLKYSTSINAVSWFISTIFIIYLLTPAILRLNNKATKHYTLIRMVCLIFVVLFFYCCFYIVLGQIEYVIFPDYYLSIIYRSPLIRIFPFLLGIVSYNIYRLLGSFRIEKGLLIEIIGIVVFFLWWIIADKTGLPTIVTECTDMIISMLVILIFAFSRRGIVSIFLGKEKIIQLGNISMEFYLVHYLVINYGMIVAKQFNLDKGIAVLPLTIMFFSISLYGACLIHFYSQWLLLDLKKKVSTFP